MIRRVGIALAPFAAIAVAGAAVIDGTTSFPGGDMPALTAYVYSIDAAKLRTAAVAGPGHSFHVDVPPGRYVVFAAPSEPGTPDVYGAYTQCGGDGAACRDHSLRSVVLDARTHRVTVTIDDWYLSDADADALDRIRGVAATPGPQPPGAPRFSEYAAPATAAAADAAAVARNSPESARRLRLALAADDRARLRDLMAAGPNFAGSVTVLRARCGRDCVRLVLLDWTDGRLVAPAGLAAIDDALPCRSSEAVLFRRDSRLLSVTRMRDGAIVTEYYLWDPAAGSVSQLAAYPRKAAQYCAIDPP
jgi:hypothetical protein